MYAIVDIAGHQFKVEKDQKVFVNRLQTEEGNKVTFDNVLLCHIYQKQTRRTSESVNNFQTPRNRGCSKNGAFFLRRRP